MRKNDHPLTPGLVTPQGLPVKAPAAGVHGAYEPGQSALVTPRRDVSVSTPTPGPAGSRPYGPVPQVGSANVPIGAPGGDIPQWPAPSLSAQTPRDPAPVDRMSLASPNHQALVDAARSRMDPQAPNYAGPKFDPDAHALRGGSR